MTTVQRAGRWDAFAPGELTALQYGLTLQLEGILESARGDEIAVEDRRLAAETLIAVAAMSHEIDDAIGKEHPPIETWFVTAQLVADGNFAAVSDGLDAERAALLSAPLGSDAAVPVAPGEDSGFVDAELLAREMNNALGVVAPRWDHTDAQEMLEALANGAEIRVESRTNREATA